MPTPRLPHNQATYRRVARRRWYVAGTVMLLAVAVALLAPADLILALLAPLFIALVIGLGAVEVRLFLVFRRDQHERERLRGGEQGDQVHTPPS